MVRAKVKETVCCCRMRPRYQALPLAIVVIIAGCIALTLPVAALTMFSGQVLEGNAGRPSGAAGVTVTLYCSNNPGDTGSFEIGRAHV